jgi:hypothetical protein
MRTVLAYTTARILMFVVALVVLYLCGARGILLLALAFVVTMVLSYIVLNKQREKIAAGLNNRLSKSTSKVTSKVSDKAAEFKERLEDGAAIEDTDEPEVAAPQAATKAGPPGAETSQR